MLRGAIASFSLRPRRQALFSIRSAPSATWRRLSCINTKTPRLRSVSSERCNLARQAESDGIAASCTPCVRAGLELGDMAGAATWITSAMDSLRDYDVTAVSEVNQTLGVIRAAQGRTEEAEAALRRGLSVLEPTDYLWNQVDPALDLARFLARQGRAEEAKRLLDKYERWVRERAIPLWDDQFEEIRALAQS